MMPYIKENKQEMSRLYTQAANQLIGELPRGWTNFVLGFFVDNQDSDTLLIYVSSDEGAQWRDFMDDVFEADEIMVGVFDCRDTLRELRELCARSGDKWSCVTLSVNKLGAFEAEFDYEPLEELTSMRKKMWVGKYLS